MEVLKKNIFQHWAAYVTSLRLLCQKTISKEDLNHAFILMDYFVRRFSAIYVIENMDYKVHVHVHYALQVLSYGSLIYITCFIFEIIKNLIKIFSKKISIKNILKTT